MNDIEQKQIEILSHERIFAFNLSENVLEKPKLNIWMIIVPFLFFYPIYRRQRYLEARNKFVQNFLITRKWALSEAVQVVTKGKTKDIAAISNQASMPEGARKAHMALLSTLVDHYVELLHKDGGTIDSLIRSAYGSRTNYMLYLNQLSRAEKQLNASIESNLSREHRNIRDTIRKIETFSEDMRRQEAERFFT
jgi:hypothetical protein